MLQASSPREIHPLILDESMLSALHSFPLKRTIRGSCQLILPLVNDQFLPPGSLYAFRQATQLDHVPDIRTNALLWIGLVIRSKSQRYPNAITVSGKRRRILSHMQRPLPAATFIFYFLPLVESIRLPYHPASHFFSLHSITASRESLALLLP